MNATGLEPIAALLVGLVFMAVVMVVLWWIQRRHGDAGIVDVGWTFGLGALVVFYAFAVDGVAGRRVLVALLAAIWSLRLGTYLLRDRIIGKEEDGRYQKLRRDWGNRAQLRFFFFYQAQGIADVVFSIPFLIAMRNPAPFPSAWDIAGLVVWVIAVGGESLADRQLERFRAAASSRGRTCRVGLWGWSRHPNYFFEWLHWWSYVLIAVGHPLAWATLFGPAVMLYLLFRVTGIPTTEARALETRGDDYRDYQRTVSVFVPLPPKSTA